MLDQVDIAPADFTVVHSRSQVVDYLPAITEIHLRIFVTNPSNSLNWLSFVRPLSANAWVLVGVAILICPFVLTLGTHFIGMNFEKHGCNRSEQRNCLKTTLT